MILKDEKIQEVFLDELKIIITTENGKIYEKGYFEKECIEYKIITNIIPKNIKKSIF